jgi:hypothetical protein
MPIPCDSGAEQISLICMKVNLPLSYQAVLLQTPVLTPTLARLENPQQTVLAMRVTDLFSFRRDGIAITIQPVGYQAREGVWVVAVAFRLGGTVPHEGVVYINPQKADDRGLLQNLAQQEQLPFIFLSPRLQVAVQQTAPWSVHHRQEVRMLLARLEHLPMEKDLERGREQDFARAKREFQRLYTVKTLLLPHARREAQIPSPFRGAVLD